MQEKNSYSMDQTDGCFQKPPMRRALGELTNSPRLLDHHLSPRFQTPNQTTPTKQTKLSPAITPTHNLKLLTELAAKVAGANGGGSIGAGSSGGGGSSARQTLQFEDVDSTYSETTPVYLGSGNNSSPATPTLLPTAVKSLATTTISPHCDHTYGNQLPNQLNASYEPKDEVCEDYIKLEPVEIHFASSRSLVDNKPRAEEAPTVKSRRDNPLPELPPESALFIPPTERGNRKDKSLGLLAEKMLQNYPYMLNHGEFLEVQLDDTAKQLNTERRRIYDIVNVFEAVQIMSKVGKNVYNWHGRTYLIHSLAWLRQLGVKLGMQEQYRMAKEQERDMMNDIENMSPLQSPRLVSPATGLSPMVSPYGSPGLSPYGSPNDPSGTSMGINTQKFLMLFLVMPRPAKLTLDFAARVIHGPNPNDKAKVTRVRRLYDIANILQALGLIRKVQIPEGKSKKPAFEYIGPEVEKVELTDEKKRSMPSARQKNSLLAVGGKNLAHLPDRDESATAAGDPSHRGGMLSPATGVNNKRTRSLSGDRKPSEVKLVRTLSVGRGESLAASTVSSNGSAPRLLELGEVCQRERERIEVEGSNSSSPILVGELRHVSGSSSSLADPSLVQPAWGNISSASSNGSSVSMKPPTPENKIDVMEENSSPPWSPHSVTIVNCSTEKGVPLDEYKAQRGMARMKARRLASGGGVRRGKGTTGRAKQSSVTATGGVMMSGQTVLRGVKSRTATIRCPLPFRGCARPRNQPARVRHHPPLPPSIAGVMSRGRVKAPSSRGRVRPGFRVQPVASVGGRVRQSTPGSLHADQVIHSTPNYSQVAVGQARGIIRHSTPRGMVGFGSAAAVRQHFMPIARGGRGQVVAASFNSTGAITNTGEEEELTDSDSTSDSDAEASDNLCDSDEDDSELLNDVSPSKLFKFSTSKRVQAIRGSQSTLSEYKASPQSPADNRASTGRRLRF